MSWSRYLTLFVFTGCVLMIAFESTWAETKPRGEKTSAELIMRPCVQKELKLDNVQVKKLESLEQVLLKQLDEPITSIEQLNHISKEFKIASHKVLRPGQLKRLKQIMVQLTGASVVYDSSEVQEKLNLSEAQKTKIFKIVRIENWDCEKLLEREHGKDVPINKMFNMRSKSLLQVSKLLTTEQRNIWDTIIGPPFHADFDIYPSWDWGNE